MVPPPRHAWTIGRLLAGRPVKGEVGELFPPFRAIGRRLLDLAVEIRPVAWEAFLDGQDDRNEIIRAVAAVDPEKPPPEAEANEARPECRLTRASDVTCRPVEWLWGQRVPRAMLSLFAGDPKLGKSFVTIAMAAGVSRGAALPGDDPHDAPGSVILLSAEDDPARTIVPRLRTAGADLDRVHILESVYLDDGSEALPSLRADAEAIEKTVMSLGDCRLVIVDPVSAYLGGTDDHRNAELRGVLTPLKGLAERSGVAIVLVTHLNKSTGTNGKHRVTGSIAYVGACRANFLFARDQDDPTGRRVLMLANGCNLAGDVPTLAYRIEDRGDGPAVEWESAPVDISVEQALAPDYGDDRRPAESHECDGWLQEMLSGGPLEQREIESSGLMVGFTKDQLRRAKDRIATSYRVGFGPGSKLHWKLSNPIPGRPEPDDATTPKDGSKRP